MDFSYGFCFILDKSILWSSINLIDLSVVFQVFGVDEKNEFQNVSVRDL